MPALSFGRLLLVLIGTSIGAASILVGVVGVLGTTMNIESNADTVVVGEQFVVSVVVTSDIPVNVFAGDLSFDHTVLQVASIDYSTSIADLWAEKPWYSNGDGTLNFAGGTTKSGGFTGEGTLLMITFNTLASQDTRIHIDDIQILQYDGLGTDAKAPDTIDSIFAITEPEQQPQVIIEKTGGGPQVAVLKQAPQTDLNGDGKQSVADVSIFMTDLISQNKRSDFNEDGTVGLKDLSILMDTL